eukprot:4655163-Prymnesium_polylepis.1
MVQQQHDQHGPTRPSVGCERVVHLPRAQHEKLRRHVQGRATHCASQPTARLSKRRIRIEGRRQAEVGDLQDSILAEEQVLRLDVAMCNTCTRAETTGSRPTPKHTRNLGSRISGQPHTLLVAPVHTHHQLLKVLAGLTLPAAIIGCSKRLQCVEELAAHRALHDKVDVMVADEDLVELDDEWTAAPDLLHRSDLARDAVDGGRIFRLLRHHFDGQLPA